MRDIWDRRISAVHFHCRILYEIIFKCVRGYISQPILVTFIAELPRLNYNAQYSLLS